MISNAKSLAVHLLPNKLLLIIMLLFAEKQVFLTTQVVTQLKAVGTAADSTVTSGIVIKTVKGTATSGTNTSKATDAH